MKSAIRGKEPLNNLTSLRATLSLTLNWVQQARDEFVNANHEYFCRFEEPLIQILFVTERLGKGFSRIGHLRGSREA